MAQTDPLGTDPLDTDSLDTDHFHEECGVFGVYGHPDAAALAALGMHALQHRGQEAAPSYKPGDRTDMDRLIKNTR